MAPELTYWGGKGKDWVLSTCAVLTATDAPLPIGPAHGSSRIRKRMHLTNAIKNTDSQCRHGFLPWNPKAGHWCDTVCGGQSLHTPCCSVASTHPTAQCLNLVRAQLHSFPPCYLLFYQQQPEYALFPSARRNSALQLLYLQPQADN